MVDHSWECWVIDDASTDGTFEKAQQLFVPQLFSSNCKAVHLHRLERNHNLGGILRWAREQTKSAYLAMIDADCSYHPQLMASMLNTALEFQADLVGASFHHPQAKLLTPIPSYRRWLSRGAQFFYQVLCHQTYWGFTSMFRLYRREALTQVEWTQNSFLAMAEIQCLFLFHQFKVIEVAGDYQQRQFGTSKAKLFQLTLGHLRQWLRLWSYQKKYQASHES